MRYAEQAEFGYQKREEQQEYVQERLFQELRLSVKSKKALEKGAKMRSNEDEQGSYTGINSQDVYEKPIQDVDDL